MYDDKYINTKARSFNNVVCTNFIAKKNRKKVCIAFVT